METSNSSNPHRVDFIPDFWQEGWAETDTFHLEYFYDDGDPSVGLYASFDISVFRNGVDITDELEQENVEQAERETIDDFNKICNDKMENFDPGERQEWQDFDPHC